MEVGLKLTVDKGGTMVHHRTDQCQRKDGPKTLQLQLYSYSFSFSLPPQFGVSSNNIPDQRISVFLHFDQRTEFCMITKLQGTFHNEVGVKCDRVLQPSLLNLTTWGVHGVHGAILRPLGRRSATDTAVCCPCRSLSDPSLQQRILQPLHSTTLTFSSQVRFPA